MADKTKILEAIKAQGLSISARFVPFSQSRNKDNKQYSSLNWEIELRKDDRPIWKGDYSAGEAHCPSYKQTFRGRTVSEQEVIDYETEHGKAALWFEGHPAQKGNKPIMPDTCDVLHALVSDASAIDRDTFESWASDYGYDADSRWAENTYRECIKIGLALRNNADLPALQELFQDY